MLVYYLHRFTSFGVILQETRRRREKKGKKHQAAVAFAPFLLIFSPLDSNPGTRTTRPSSCHFLDLFMKSLPHFQSQKKGVRCCCCFCCCFCWWSSSSSLLGLWQADINISRCGNKRHDRYRKMSPTYRIQCKEKQHTGGG